MPRPQKLKALRSESGTSLASLSAASSKSGYSSPTKQLHNLEFHPRRTKDSFTSNFCFLDKHNKLGHMPSPDTVQTIL
ncbi:Uncharacterized protein HZ326_22723 [Fusarium oxysporum f. sp. albedinis]|nr:Uncharacterized protein HZ326_22723 [Fusarium oxysporum f. sp. albedinis]